MKRLRLFVPFLVLALFLGFTPACNGTEPVVEEESVDELYPSKIAIPTEKEWFFDTIWKYVKNNENRQIKTLEDFLTTNKDHFVDKGNWEAIERELNNSNSFSCVTFKGKEAKKQCKALVNFYVYYVLERGVWVDSDKYVIKNSALRLSDNLGKTVVNKKRENYNIKALLGKGVRKGDVFFIYVNPQDEWGHYGIIYDVTDDDVLVLDANRKFDGKLRISSIEDLISYVGDSWTWVEVARFAEEVTGELEEALDESEAEEMEDEIKEEASPENTAPEPLIWLFPDRPNGDPIACNIPASEGIFVFKDIIMDDEGNNVKLQMELKPLNESFTGVPNYESDWVKGYSNSPLETPLEIPPSKCLWNPDYQEYVASISVYLTEGAYHWQHRAIDEYGATSSWRKPKQELQQLPTKDTAFPINIIVVRKEIE